MKPTSFNNSRYTTYIPTDPCTVTKIKSNQDQIDMLRDLDALMDWGSTWGMKFNAKKCNIMRFSQTSAAFLQFMQ